MRAVIVADDLTGATDAAAPFVSHGTRVTVTAWTPAMDLRGVLRQAGDDDVVAIDTDTRDRDPDTAAQRAREVGAMLAAHPARWTIKKVDSLLRGPIAAEIGALRATLCPSLVVAAPALPAANRTTVGGCQLVAGQPIGTTGHDPRDAADPARTPAVGSACGLHDHRVHGADALDLGHDGEVVVDAVTDTDLDRVVAAVAKRSRAALLIGSSGLTQAVARAESANHQQCDRYLRPADDARPRCLVVSLSPTDTARTQVAHLEQDPATATVRIDVGDLLADPESTITSANRRLRELRRDAQVLVLTTAGDLAGSLPRNAASTVITAACSALVASVPDRKLVLANGGDAARCVLEARGAHQLEVLRNLGDGAALSRSGTLYLVTKSGSFGGPSAVADALVAATRCLLEPTTRQEST